MTLENDTEIVDAKEKCLIAELEQICEEQKAESSRTQAEMEAAIGLVMLSVEPVILPRRAHTPPMRFQISARRKQPVKLSTLIAKCRDIVKEILAKNGYHYPYTSTPRCYTKEDTFFP